MKKLTRISAVIALIALVAPIALAGARDTITIPRLPNIQEGQLYNRSDLFPLPEDGDIYPRSGANLSDADSAGGAVDPTDAVIAIERGPMVLPTDFNLSTLSLSPAIPGSGGGSFLTPRLQAEMEIRRLIKRLN